MEENTFANVGLSSLPGSKNDSQIYFQINLAVKNNATINNFWAEKD